MRLRWWFGDGAPTRQEVRSLVCQRRRLSCLRVNHHAQGFLDLKSNCQHLSIAPCRVIGARILAPETVVRRYSIQMVWSLQLCLVGQGVHRETQGPTLGWREGEFAPTESHRWQTFC